MPKIAICCLRCIYGVFVLQQEADSMRNWTAGVRLCTYTGEAHPRLLTFYPP